MISWKILEQNFESYSNSSLLNVKADFHNLKIVKGHYPYEYITMLEKLQMILNYQLNGEITETELLIHIINVLNETYENVIYTLH